MRAQEYVPSQLFDPRLVNAQAGCVLNCAPMLGRAQYPIGRGHAVPGLHWAVIPVVPSDGSHSRGWTGRLVHS